MHGLGVNLATASVLSVTRLVGLLVFAVLALWLLWHSERRGWVHSLGVTLILLVELGPVVQPWYLAWGLVLLAASYAGREHFWLLALSITGPFIGIPGGRELLAGLVHSNPLLIAVAVALLGGVLLVPMGRWTQWRWPEQLVEPSRSRARRHHVLVLDDVEPDAVLAPDLDLGADQGEPALLVQADRLPSFSPTMRAISEWKPERARSRRSARAAGPRRPRARARARWT